jgi:hypothetical protein
MSLGHTELFAQVNSLPKWHKKCVNLYVNLYSFIMVKSDRQMVSQLQSIWLYLNDSLFSIIFIDYLLPCKCCRAGTILILFFFFFVVPGFELRAYTLNHSTSPFLWWYFWDRVSWTICPSWLQTSILLISASWVVRITDVSHWYPVSSSFLQSAQFPPSQSLIKTLKWFLQE